jgi:GNAT superfamily N-acetyltransferase
MNVPVPETGTRTFRGGKLGDDERNGEPVGEFEIRPIRAEDKDWIRRLMRDRWSGGFIVIRGEKYHPVGLPGFIAQTGPEKNGLITYLLAGGDCEIMTLDSLEPGKGIGRALIEAVKETARRAGCRRLRVVTTNDNLRALRFYQRRGFTLASLRPNAIEATRKLKPIPRLGEDGIPIRDEIELEMILK